jgi:signal transduction histidine kinase
MDRLYEAFFSTKAEGMGIGLNLCRTIVESHQGRMHAENIYNSADVTGCEFSFWIPVNVAIHNTAGKDTGVTA